MENQKSGGKPDKDPGWNRSRPSTRDESPPEDSSSRAKSSQSKSKPRDDPPRQQQKKGVQVEDTKTNENNVGGLFENDRENIKIMLSLLSLCSFPPSAFAEEEESFASVVSFVDELAGGDRTWLFPVKRSSGDRFEYVPANPNSTTGGGAVRLFRQLQDELGDEILSLPSFAFGSEPTPASLEQFQKFGNVLVLRQDGLAPIMPSTSSESANAAVAYMAFSVVRTGDRALIFVSAMHFRRQGTCPLTNASSLLTLFYSGVAAYVREQLGKAPAFVCRVVFATNDTLEKLPIVGPFHHDWMTQSGDAEHFAALVGESHKVWVRPPIDTWCSPLSLLPFEDIAPHGHAVRLGLTSHRDAILSTYAGFALLPDIVRCEKFGLVALCRCASSSFPSPSSLKEQLVVNGKAIHHDRLNPKVLVSLLMLLNRRHLSLDREVVELVLAEVNTISFGSSVTVGGQQQKMSPALLSRAHEELNKIITVLKDQFGPAATAELSKFMVDGSAFVLAFLEQDATMRSTLASASFKSSVWGSSPIQSVNPSSSSPFSLCPLVGVALQEKNIPATVREAKMSETVSTLSFPGVAASTEVPEELRKIKKWMGKKLYEELTKSDGVMPDEAIECLITLITFHNDTANDHSVYVVRPEAIQCSLVKGLTLKKEDLYDVLHQYYEYRETRLIVIPFPDEKHRMTNGVGHWLVFALDFSCDTIYAYDPTNEFKGADQIADDIRMCFISPHLVYLKERPGPISNVERGKVPDRRDETFRADAFKLVCVRMPKGRQNDAFSCGFWAAKMILGLAVEHCAPKDLDVTVECESFRQFILKMMQTRDLYIDGVYRHPSLAQGEQNKKEEAVAVTASALNKEAKQDEIPPVPSVSVASAPNAMEAMMAAMMQQMQQMQQQMLDAQAKHQQQLEEERVRHQEELKLLKESLQQQQQQQNPPMERIEVSAFAVPRGDELMVEDNVVLPSSSFAVVLPSAPVVELQSVNNSVVFQRPVSPKGLVGTKRSYKTATKGNQSAVSDGSSDIDSVSGSSIPSVKGSVKTNTTIGKKMFHCLICEKATSYSMLSEYRYHLRHFERAHSDIPSKEFILLCGSDSSCCVLPSAPSVSFWSKMTNENKLKIAACNQRIKAGEEPSFRKKAIENNASLSYVVDEDATNYLPLEQDAPDQFVGLSQDALQQLPEIRQKIPTEMGSFKQNIPSQFEEEKNVLMEENIEQINTFSRISSFVPLAVVDTTPRAQVLSLPPSSLSLRQETQVAVPSVFVDTTTTAVAEVSTIVNTATEQHRISVRRDTEEDERSSVSLERRSTVSGPAFSSTSTVNAVLKELRALSASKKSDARRQEALVELFPHLRCEEVYKFFQEEKNELIPVVLLL